MRRPGRSPVRRRYEDVLLATKPIWYVPLQGAKPRELVRGVFLTSAGVRDATLGPFPGAGAAQSNGTNATRLTIATDTSYHPGDTFSIGGWFNRTGGTSPIMVSAQANDYTVYFDASNKLALRKSGVSDIFATTAAYAATTGWRFGLFTKNAGIATLCYVDAVSVAGSFANATIVAGTGDVTFFEAATGGNDYAGSLAHWAMWNRVLTAAEVRELYLAGINRT